MIEARQRRFGRVQVAVAAALALALAVALAWGILRSPDVPFLRQDDTPWIVAQTPLQTNGIEIEHAQPPLSFFERRFTADGRTRTVTLRVRALRDVSLYLNGKELPLGGRDPARWKDAVQLDVTSLLVPGENVLFARVRNPAGAPAMQLRLDGLDAPIVSDGQWRAAWEGDPVSNAVLAEDSVRYPESLTLPSPPAAFAGKAIPLLLLGVFGGVLFLLLRRRPDLAEWAPAAALALTALYWALLLRKLLDMPGDVGFDARAHRQYIDWIVAHRALPDPGDGTAMYHPPLYHALSALLLVVLAPGAAGARAIVALLPMLSGFGMAVVARGMTRALLPGAPWLAAGAVFVAGFLPMNLTLATCVSNEAPHALLASVALLVAVRAMTRERASLHDDVLLGAVLGAALLTKYSSLLLVPILLGALATKRVAVGGVRFQRVLSGGCLSLAIVVGVAGWVYLRNYLLSGDPLVWNMNVNPAKSWWQLPGFHTAAYFLRFGDALTHPWFSSFYSFWDALYTTFWGDGLLSGVTAPALAGPRFRYDWMAAGFLLALPATAFLAVGWMRAALLAFRGTDLGRRLSFSLVALLPPVFLVSLLSLSLHYPFWSVGKAFYALSLTPAIAVLGVLGFDALDGLLARRLPVAVRVLPYCWATAFLGAVACAYLG